MWLPQNSTLKEQTKIYCTGSTNVYVSQLCYIKLVGEQLWQSGWSIWMSCDQSDCHVLHFISNCRLHTLWPYKYMYLPHAAMVTFNMVLRAHKNGRD